MNANLKYIVVTLAVVLIGLACGEAYLRVSVVPRENIARIVQRVYRGQGSNVILGDSHTQAAFMRELPDFVNLSRGGTNPRMMEVLAREWFRHRDPGRVIVLASPQMFAKNRAQAGLKNFDRFFTQNRIGIRRPLYVFEFGISQFAGGDKRYLFPEDYRKFLTGKAPKNKRGMPDKEIKRPSTKAQREQEGRSRAREHTPIPKFQRKPDYRAYVRLLRFLGEIGAEVCMVRPPVSREYLRNAETRARYRKAVAEIKRLAVRHHHTYVDFQSLGLDHAPSMFFNADHLDAPGRQVFAPAAEKACFGVAQ